ncbi:MAG: cell division protein FtsA [Clostridia bacterium]
MAIGDIIVGLDIGASKTCSLVGQVNKFSEIEVIGYGISNNSSLKKGKIVDLQETAKSIKEAINLAEEVSGLSINSAYVNAKGMNVRIQSINIESDTEKPDDGLSVTDINNLFYKIQLSTKLEKDEQIIDILPKEYKVHDKIYKQEPLGSFCKKFEVEADVVIAKGEYLEGILNVLKLADIKLDGVILETLATSNIVLMPEEKELGTILIDIGAGHTDISVYKNSELKFYDTLPVGGNNITNDIAISFDISTDEADKLKKQYNLAIQAMIKNNHEIKLNTVSSSDGQSIVKCSDVVQIIEARIKQIYQVIKKIIVENKLNSDIECMVLTGQGISNIIGVEELAMLILKLNQVRICSPKLVNVIKPQHTTVFGMVRYISSLGLSKHVNSEVEIITEPLLKDKVLDIFKGTKDKFKKVFNRIKQTDEENDE